MSAYGYDSPRRRAARRRRYWAAAWRRFRVAVVLTLVAMAAFIVVSDRLGGGVQRVNFVDEPATHAPTPHVAKSPRNAVQRHPPP